MLRLLYATVGAVLVIFVDLAVNLIAAAIQSRSFSAQFDSQSVYLLALLIGAGLFLGWFFGGDVEVPATTRPAAPGQPPVIEPPRTITRLRALLSYAKLRGQGISLSDILLIGSKLDIDTRDK